MSELKSDYEIEYKTLKKQLKLTRGLDRAPEEHRVRLAKHLEELQVRTGYRSEKAVLERLEYLKAEIERAGRGLELPPEVMHRLWFLRPLLAHLDHPGKMRSLADPVVGASALNTTVNMHLPLEWGLSGLADRDARRYFAFKALGKSSEGSRELEHNFQRHVQTTYELPFSVPGITDLPLMHYNIDRFWTHTVSEGRDICIVSGICPLSIITDELVFETASGENHRPELGFEPLTPDDIGNEKIVKVFFPARPLLADYIELSRTFELAKYFAGSFPSRRVKIKLWLPMYEYELALTREALSVLIEHNMIDAAQVRDGLGALSKRYHELVKLVSSELDHEGDLEIVTTDEKILELHTGELEILLGKTMDDIISSEVTKVYGLYKGSELRRKLFALLAFKHFQPLLEDHQMNILHIENSYELWPNLVAARWAEDWCARSLPECGELKQVFAFICTPSIPSPSLRYMRTLNAPYDHKYYLALPPEKLDEQNACARPQYLEMLGAILPWLKSDPKDPRSLKNDLAMKFGKTFKNQ